MDKVKAPRARNNDPIEKIRKVPRIHPEINAVGNRKSHEKINNGGHCPIGYYFYRGIHLVLLPQRPYF